MHIIENDFQLDSIDHPTVLSVLVVYKLCTRVERGVPPPGGCRLDHPHGKEPCVFQGVVSHYCMSLVPAEWKNSSEEEDPSIN